MESCKRCGASMTAQGANRFVCEFCGNTLLIEPKTPKVENIPQQQPIREREVVYVRETVDKSEEKLGCRLGGLCFCVPIVGLLLYFGYKSNGKKHYAQIALTLAIIGGVGWIIFLVTRFIHYVPGFGFFLVNPFS